MPPNVHPAALQPLTTAGIKVSAVPATYTQRRLPNSLSAKVKKIRTAVKGYKNVSTGTAA